MFHRLRALLSLLLIVSFMIACSTAAPPAPTATLIPPTQAPTPTSPPPTSTAVPTFASTATALPSTPTTVPPATPTTAPTATVVAYPVTVVDDDKRKVTFDAAPQRIVSLSPGLTETLYALGAGDRVIVTDQFSDFPAENKPKAKLNTYPKPNVEELVSLKPDLILVLVEGDDFVQQMDARGIKVLRVFPKTYDGTLQDIVWLGKVLGASARASQISANMRERADAVVARTKNAPKILVFYEIDASDPTKPWVAGPDGFFGNLVPLAGGKNIFDDIATSAGQVSAEQIVSRNPDLIILGDTTAPSNAQTPALVKARPGWSGISAVKNNRILIIDDALLTRPGPRLIDGLETMARLLHPELFP